MCFDILQTPQGQRGRLLTVRKTVGRKAMAFVARLVTLVTPVVVIEPESASAATFSAPSVIGLNGRPEVLAAQGTATGSYLTMAPYVADGTANATRQRWTFEQIVFAT